MSGRAPRARAATRAGARDSQAARSVDVQREAEGSSGPAPDPQRDETTPDRYRLDLPRGWQRFDRGLLRATELSVGAVGVMFTVLVTAEVVSRYVFSFSIVWVNSASIFLMVWFFLLGAGLALRRGAHVGFDLTTTHLSPLWARTAFVLAQTLSFAFFLAMLWSGIRTIGPASRQMEGALGISLMWGMLAFPVGFLLLIYNQAAMFVASMRRRGVEDPSS